MCDTRLPATTAGMALACLCWAAALRLPVLGNVGEDEAFFVLVAQRWLAGLAPYAASFDVKPPGLFAVLALAQACFGSAIGTLKGVEIGCVGATALALWLIGARHLSRPVGLWAALLYPLYSLTLSGANSAAELIAAPAEAFAVLAVLEALSLGRLRWAALAGLLLGAAGMIRQNAAFPAAALLAALLVRWPAGRKPPVLLAFGGAIAVVPLLFALLFLAEGAFGALLDGAVLGAAGRMRGDNIGFAAGVLRFLPSMRPLAALLCGPVLLATRSGRWRGGALTAGSVVTLAWLAGAAGGILAVRSMYDHYFLAIVPPLLLASGIALFHLLDARSPAARPMRLLVLLVAATFPFVVDRTALQPGTDAPAAAAAAAAVHRVGVPADATMLVANRDLLTYLAARRQPAGRYFHPQHLLCDFPAADADPLASALAMHPGVLVVADLSRGMICTRPDRIAKLQAAIAAGFCAAGQGTGERDRIDIYVDRSRYPAICAHAAAPTGP
jgi:4-amino-4-deoxy-L-arabinose transferase-like glycosyltransferase